LLEESILKIFWEEVGRMAQPRTSRPGHLAEAKLVEFFGSLPGVESAEISGDLEDKIDKIDILLRLKGDYFPLKLQVTGNPRKSPRGLPKDVIFFRFDLEEVLYRGVSKALAMQCLQKIISWLKFNEPERLQGLLAYWSL